MVSLRCVYLAFQASGGASSASSFIESSVQPLMEDSQLFAAQLPGRVLDQGFDPELLGLFVLNVIVFGHSPVALSQTELAPTNPESPSAAASRVELRFASHRWRPPSPQTEWPRTWNRRAPMRRPALPKNNRPRRRCPPPPPGARQTTGRRSRSTSKPLRRRRWQ